LAAVTQGHIAEEAARSISIFIDVSEVKGLLKKAGFGRVLTAPSSVTAAASPPAAQDGPAEKEAPNVATQTPKVDDKEKQAENRLKMAKVFVTDRPAIARERLEQLIKDYPDTLAAKEAKQLLGKLK
jgi:hypothetical protein